MALLTLLTGQKPKRVGIQKQDKTADIMLIDATLSETTNLEAEASEHPIEDGPDITDHIRPKPVTVDIDGIISETPLTLIEDIQTLRTESSALIKNAARGFAGAAIADLSRAFGKQFGNEAGAVAAVAGASLFQDTTNPAKQSRDTLEDILLRRQLVTLQTKYKSYSNMALISLSFPRSNENGKVLRFSARFKQINIVVGETVEIKKIARSAAGGAAKKASLGSQASAPPTTDVAKKSSLAFKGFQSLFGGR